MFYLHYLKMNKVYFRELIFRFVLNLYIMLRVAEA